MLARLILNHQAAQANGAVMWTVSGLACFGILLAVSGCSSFAKGVTEAILEKSASEDKRACHIDGPAFEGLGAALQRQEADRAAGRAGKNLKVLMVHGIGPHIPGYSGRLTEKLMRELKLDLRSEAAKEITLSDPDFGDGPSGLLRVWRYENKARTRELLFYELTWSQIAEQEKKAIAYDASVEQSHRRAGVNNLAKDFFNGRVPDALIYLGATRRPILASVRQTICWATRADWKDLPDSGKHECDLFDPVRARHIRDDDFAFITHSLGSRITIDALQRQVEFAAGQRGPAFVELRNAMRDKEFTVFMMANQLPLLQLGQPPAAVSGKIAAYCRPNGALYADRQVSGMNIKAFSDPNDILSYSIPPKFADEYLDSRLCPSITNVALNIANPISVFGLDAVNPGEAHGGYDYDDRVIGLMAHGLGTSGQSPIVKQRCTWQETVASN